MTALLPCNITSWIIRADELPKSLQLHGGWHKNLEGAKLSGISTVGDHVEILLAILTAATGNLEHHHSCHLQSIRHCPGCADYA